MQTLTTYDYEQAINRAASEYEGALARAHADIRKLDGFAARTNVRSCCRSCAAHEMKQSGKYDGKVFLWNGAIQGSHGDDLVPQMLHRNRWTDYGPNGRRVSEYEMQYDIVYVNHAELNDASFQKVEAIYRAHGLTAEWDGSEWSCVLVSVSGEDFAVAVESQLVHMEQERITAEREAQDRKERSERRDDINKAMFGLTVEQLDTIMAKVNEYKENN